jgi:hypothetical protein
MLLGRTRWLHTCSLKWINPGHRINIGRAERDGERAHRRKDAGGEVCGSGGLRRLLRWPPGDGKEWTTCSLTRRGREQDRRRRFLPGASRRGDRSGSRRRWDAGEVPLLDLLQNRGNGEYQKERQDLGRSMDQKGAALSHCDGRIEENMAAAVVNSDDESRQPGGAIWRGSRGERQRGSWATYRRGRGAVSAAD